MKAVYLALFVDGDNGFENENASFVWKVVVDNDSNSYVLKLPGGEGEKKEILIGGEEFKGIFEKVWGDDCIKVLLYAY